MSARRVYLISSVAQGIFLSLIFTVNQLYRVTTVGLTPLQLVLVGTTLEATVFIFEIPTGVVADVFSRRLSTIIGIFLFGVGFIIEGAIPLFAAVLMAQVVWGLGWTFISGARSAWIADEVGTDKVGPIYMRGTQFHQAGSLLGIPLGVALGRIALNLPILVGGGLFLVLGLFLILAMPEEGFKPTPPGERQTWGVLKSTLHDGAKLIRSRPTLMIFLVIALFVGLYSEGYDRLSEAHFLGNFTFPTVGNLDVVTWFGIMRVGTTLSVLGVSEIVKRRLDTENQAKLSRVLQAIYGLVVIGLLTFALTENFGIALLATWLVDTARVVSFPLNTTWINHHIDSKVRATVLSMTSQVDALGQMIGGPIIGLIGTLRSLRAALSTSGLILSPVLFMYERVYRKNLAHQLEHQSISIEE